MDVREQVGLSPAPESGKYSGAPVEVSGKRYGSIGEAARALGINSASFGRRLQEGMTPDEAFRRARVKKW